MSTFKSSKREQTQQSYLNPEITLTVTDIKCKDAQPVNLLADKEVDLHMPEPVRIQNGVMLYGNNDTLTYQLKNSVNLFNTGTLYN